MRDESTSKEEVDAPDSPQRLAEGESMMQDLELRARAKMANFASFQNKIRATWQTFTWPRPSTRSRGPKKTTNSSKESGQ